MEETIIGPGTGLDLQALLALTQAKTEDRLNRINSKFEKLRENQLKILSLRDLILKANEIAEPSILVEEAEGLGVKFTKRAISKEGFTDTLSVHVTDLWTITDMKLLSVQNIIKNAWEDISGLEENLYSVQISQVKSFLDSFKEFKHY